MTKHPLTLTADATVWYAIESALKFAATQEALGTDAPFVQKLLDNLGTAITAAENGSASATIS